MVAAVHFYATAADQRRLLDYLGEPAEVTLKPWPVVSSPQVTLSRDDALDCGQVMVVSKTLGPPVVLGEQDTPFGDSARAALFHELNWERLKPKPGERLVDSNASPVLLWTPAIYDSDGLRSGSIGSQADSMKTVSEDYAHWVNRVVGWIRRRGTPVWGWQPQHQRSDLDLRRTDVTTVYALPDAHVRLEGGTPGH